LAIAAFASAFHSERIFFLAIAFAVIFLAIENGYFPVITATRATPIE
jgi:hypothetical protein